jgi:YidC/Oxa1 family membrane protein insertase
MDRNTIIGLTLIGVILVVFTLFNQPSAEDLKKEKAKIEAADKKEAEAEKAAEAKAEAAEKEKAEKKLAAEKFVPQKDASGKEVKDAQGNRVYVNPDGQTKTIATILEKEQKAKDSTVATAPKVDFQAETIRLESDKVIAEFSTKGGIVESVQLKEFETYHNFNKNDGKITPLYLFEKGDQVNELAFPLNGQEYTTGDKEFTVKSKTKNKIVLEHKIGDGAIQYVYTLRKGYDLTFAVKFKKLGNQVQAKSVLMNWNMSMRKTERLLSEQRKVSTICYELKDGSFDYLNEMGNDEEAITQPVGWIAYKQSYFSAIIQPEKPFGAHGTKIKATNFGETAPKFHTHIRSYKSSVNLALPSSENGTVKMNWFFGPNDYKTLKAYDNNYEDILNYGWGLFRWINLYAVQPVFDLLTSTGMGIGIAILLLTFILKLILMPIQWKMFVSSAKMRILKPNIDEINAKYPNKEDAMKKQMDMMALYRESGASPLAGCLPMLIQMPILLAVFRFFPATFELRQRGFLWAEDMSSYDSVWDFGTYIPMYGDHMSLFTILMAVTTLVYTYLNSSNVQQQQQPGMPNMKVIMYIFPVMMIFFFNNFASGLSYYYFISTLMTIILMYVIKQFFVDEEKLKAKMAAARSNSAKNGPKKKSKFAQRLEDAQRQQQEMRKKK